MLISLVPVALYVIDGGLVVATLSFGDSEVPAVNMIEFQLGDMVISGPCALAVVERRVFMWAECWTGLRFLPGGDMTAVQLLVLTHAPESKLQRQIRVFELALLTKARFSLCVNRMRVLMQESRKCCWWTNSQSISPVRTSARTVPSPRQR
jgi:hypothetical protein